MIDIQKQRAACAKFQGLELYRYADGTPYIWLLNGRELCRFADYRPDENIEQANELWKKVHDFVKGPNDIHIERCVKGMRFMIWWNSRWIDQEGPWWPQALTAAVAKLQKAIEAKERK